MKYECKLCNYNSDYRSDYKHNIIVSHPESINYKCHDCCFCTDSKNVFRKHLKSPNHLKRQEGYFEKYSDIKQYTEIELFLKKEYIFIMLIDT